MDKQNLKRRRQTWYLRCHIPDKVKAALDQADEATLPKHLQRYHGKVEIVESLGTRDLAEARRRRHDALARIHADFQQVERGEPQEWSTPQHIINAARSTRAAIEAGRADPRTMRRDFSAAVDAHLDPSTLDLDLKPISPRPQPPEGDYEPAVDLAYKIIDGRAGMLLSEAAQRHIAELQHTRAQTRNARRSRIDEFAEWIGRDIEVRQITRKMAGDYAAHLATMPLAPKTKQDRLSDLSAFFSWCMDRGTIDINPFARMSRTIRTSTRGIQEKLGRGRRPWTNDELQRLLQVILEKAKGSVESDLWRMTVIGLYSGMRQNEIAGMKATDVHDGCFHVVEGKTRAAVRAVPIHPLIKPLVTGLVDLAAKSKDGFLIPGLANGGEDKKRNHGFSKKFGRFVRARVSDDKRLVFHGLRNTFITALENNGVPKNVAHQIVGHEKEGMSYGTYSGGVDVKKLARIVAKVNYGAEVTGLVGVAISP